MKRMEEYNVRIKESIEYMQFQQSLIMMYLTQNKSVGAIAPVVEPQPDLNHLVFNRLLNAKKPV